MRKQVTRRKRMVTALGSGVLALSLLGGLGVQPASAATGSSWGFLPCYRTGQSIGIVPDWSLMYSPGNFCLVNGPYKAVFQSDSNFVVYKNGTALWHTRTNGKNAKMLALQHDGNIVVYGQSMNVLWQSGTPGLSSGSTRALRMQSDGNFVMYHNSGSSARAVWQTQTYGR
ncbi:putative D-mannose binding-like domain protein [Arthrobacter sp. Rue61a]|uniref:D-mannose binding-like domain n=1 Tax=Paenarthrobacter aurescens (strain TC1) TaxID=290340 RepID=A1R0V7_PAEAT|nr:putative D-mannose binding-like domain [Paenarthrobacter aurescens TC1]AFR26983.1 putative D-mannose binding-like domain protein [Arthrobacter sp. Rue61a]MBP2268187.1 hypothetical protein [Pseudarthrobacter sp. PvP004]